jgi:hypothetical protein
VLEGKERGLHQRTTLAGYSYCKLRICSNEMACFVDDDDDSNAILDVTYRLDKIIVTWLFWGNQLAAYDVINYQLFYRYLLFN